MQNIFQKNRMIVVHILFWLVYFSFFFYQISTSSRSQRDETPFLEIFLNAFTIISYLAIVAYFNYFITLTRYFQHKNGLRYAAEFGVMALIALLIYVPIRRYMADGYTHQEHFFYSSRFVVTTFVNSVLVAAFVAALRFFTEWQELEAQKTMLRNEKLNSELKFLKNQINPHFLFNTLNNLYSLAYSQSPQTTEVISRLSQMMRYMVYDCNNDTVSLEKEIEYINNYISLEKLRLNESIPISFEINGDPKNKQIMPLLLIPFLENSFKHGVSNNHASWVKATLDCNSHQIKLLVSNSKMSNNGSSASSNSGVGLENVKRRLELNYPNKHKLQIQTDDQKYSAYLEVQLM